MLIGNYPVADEIGDDDILIISKDGVHLLQVTVRQAGFGGGLKWWVETETDIYREYEASELGYASLVKVLVGTQWECDAYSFMNTYYIPEIFPQVCMLSDIDKLGQPENRLGKIMAMNVRTQETADNCGPDSCLAHRNTYTHYGPYYTGNVNTGSTVGLKVSTSCQKSNDYPVVTIAGCKMYCVSEEYLIKNFPMFTYTDYARYTDWCFTGSGLGDYPGGHGQGTGFDGYVAAEINCPTRHGGGFYVNGELNSLGEQYGNYGWYKYWDPTPLPKHDDYSNYHAASEGWQGLQEYKSIDGFGRGGGVLHNNDTDDYSANAIYNACRSISVARGSVNFAPLIDALTGCFATGVNPYDILEAAGTDDPSGAINQICEAHTLWKNEHGWQPKPESEWWTGNETVKEVTQYTITIDVVSPFSFATEHEEPVMVIYNTYGYEPDPARTEINVNDYTRETEYNRFDSHSNLPYDSNINPLATWQTYNDPIHDPGGSSGNRKIDLTRNNWGYWGHWTNDDEHETGMNDISVMDPLTFNRLNNGGIAWDVTYVPITRNWFDRDSENRAVNRKGYFDTEWNQFEYPFSIRDFEGNFHTYPDFIYQEDTDPLATHCYNYLAFDHPYTDQYDYRYDTKEPDERIVQDICVGTFDIDDNLTYDFSLGNHWIFDKEFLQENLEEHIFIDEDSYDYTEILYDDDVTHVPPHPDQTRIYHMYNLYICKGYTAKTDMGEKALRRARKCFDTFLKNSRSRIVFPKVAEGDSGPKLKTAISVDGDAFWTGYVTEAPDPDEPEVMVKTEHKQFNVDQDTGDVDTQGKYMIKGVDIRDILQEKLVAGKGISLHSNGKGTTTVTNTMMDTALDELVDTFHGSAGIIVAKTTDPNTHEDEVHFNLNHDLMPITNETKQQSEHPEDLIPVQVHRTTNLAQYRLVDELYFDRTNVGYHELIADNGLELTDSQNRWVLRSTALDNIRVNGVKQEKIFDLYPSPGEDGDGYYVDIQIESGGGGEVEETIPSPVPDYEKRKIVNKLYAVNHVFSAPADGYLFLEIRNSSPFYCKLEIDGKYYTVGNMNEATNKQVFSDSSNMLPLYRGQKVTLVEKTSNVNISTSESATGVDKFWFIPMVRQKMSSDRFTLGYYVYSNSPITSIPASSIKTDGASDPYVYTPTADCAIVTDVNNLRAKNLYIYPLDENDQPLGQYILGRCYDTSSTAQRFNNGQILLKKGQKYRITKASSSTTETYYIYGLNYMLKTNYESSGSLWSPFLDWANAEVIELASGYDATWVDIPAPVKTETPGILYIDGDNAYTADYSKGVQLQFGSGNDGKTKLFYKSDTSGHNYIRVPGYNSAYASTKWKYYKDFDSFNPLKLVFVPFMQYKKPGVDHVVVDHEFIDDNGIVDLSYLYSKIADLEARVAALENPT